jgi:hypothetical protein
MAARIGHPVGREPPCLDCRTQAVANIRGRGPGSAGLRIALRRATARNQRDFRDMAARWPQMFTLRCASRSTETDVASPVVANSVASD